MIVRVHQHLVQVDRGQEEQHEAGDHLQPPERGVAVRQQAPMADERRYWRKLAGNLRIARKACSTISAR
jgi:hypothetical protein